MDNVDTAETVEISRRRSSTLVGAAVHRNRLFSKAGLTERAFTFAFSSLVYPQIWEDPVVDMEAMEIEPDHRIIAIASGGCNALSYLIANPAEITLVDLNASHVALNRLKNAAARHLPDHETFFRFFGLANSRRNVAAYETYIRPHLDAETESYWSGRDLKGRRRIDLFARGFYRYGLLGNFISAGHLAARLFGKNPRRMMEARSLTEQREIYERDLAPLFKKPFVRLILNQRSSLFGLGIPPAQYDALAGGRPMHEVVEERLRRLACGFDLNANYFAWQAFHRGYREDGMGPLPPYLERQNFEAVRNRADRITIRNVSFTTHLETLAPASLDRYVLLDAQDWMTDEDLSALWAQITRTARRGARVIFRTAGEETILPGRVPDNILSRWHYEAARSAELSAKDRSAIYGAFHLYVLQGDAS